MNYLFFDIECANCFDSAGKICEFGYVLVDKDFNVIEKDNIVINPNAPFDWYVIKKMLAYKESEYLKCPKYPYFYEKIKSLFVDTNMIFGHTVDADAKYLNDENKRYKLPFFDYPFYDIMYIYRDYTKSDEKLGLTKIANAIGCEPPEHEHRALDDATSTMYILKSICEELKLTPKEIVKKYTSCCGNTINGEITTISREQAKAIKIERLQKSNKLRGEKFADFVKLIDHVKPKGKIIPSELNNKKLCITLNYQNNNAKEMMKLVQILKNHGCTLTLKATKCDYFVTKEVLNKDGSVKNCTRLEYVKKANLDNNRIKIITFDKLMEMLNIKEEDLSI